MENRDDHTLLQVIANSIENIKEDIREIKDSLKSKVEVSDFMALKSDVEDLKKKSWFTAGIMSAISFIASHFMK